MLLTAIATMYSGLERLFFAWLPYLHYGFDILVIVTVILLVMSDPARVREFRRVSSYGLWITYYFVWGLLVATNRDQVLVEAVRGVGLNLLILGAIAIALPDRQAVRNLANLIQLTVLANFAFSIWQFVDPQFLATIATHIQATMYNLDRPAGLWVNPNEAAIGFLFGFLVARWAGPRLAWSGRLAAVGGVYLTASRGGMYPLFLVVAVYSALAVRTRFHVGTRLLVIAIASISTVTVLATVAWTLQSSNSVSATRGLAYAVSRFLNPAESRSEPGDVPRATVAPVWLKRALTGPFQGSGVFSFQGSATVPGAHNIFIVVWGEAGLASALLYLLVLTIGIRRVATAHLSSGDRLALSLMWFVYLIEGFLWHNQFTAVLGIVIVALLYCMPEALQTLPRFSPITHRSQNTGCQLPMGLKSDSGSRPIVHQEPRSMTAL